MERIAYISAGVPVYFNGIVLTIAAAGAMCFFLAFYLNRSENFSAGFAALPLSLGLGIVFSRLCHWYARPDGYAGFLAAMTDYTSGGFALLGAFAGCLLGAGIVRVLFLNRNLPQMLDCMAIAGCAGMAVGRLASFFNSSDRGQIVEKIQSLPFVYPVTNAVSGQLEYRLATFVIQAMVAGALFVGLAIFEWRSRGRKQDGDTCLIFLLFYGASQVVLDSTRYDSLFFRWNGFVSIVQVLSAIAIVLVIVVFSSRLVKNRGFQVWYLGAWALIAGGIGLAGFMEYYVQRHGNAALFAYTLMSLSLVLTAGLTVLLYKAGRKREKLHHSL